MPLLKAEEIRAMTEEEREEKLIELRDELLHEKGQASMGGAPESPGRIRAIRKTISRILTVMNESKNETKGGK